MSIKSKIHKRIMYDIGQMCVMYEKNVSSGYNYKINNRVELTNKQNKLLMILLDFESHTSEEIARIIYPKQTKDDIIEEKVYNKLRVLKYRLNEKLNSLTTEKGICNIDKTKEGYKLKIKKDVKMEVKPCKYMY